ncbi:hypothetical protein [Anaerolinea thermophila]|uniref:Uncharacterized protein n=1 Tax=Anaerolinea thermophila (strain DSM 14523 / JCM 11388 / NBRC 100420 / UNI-1) TaxID=926569 RepID=E8N192_ANATU|nr:hypothetical protein [Anaerolinea thermophila]BAJ64835.1 hypothetical protein ANT_28090 [Anaerolinea thermophila UNI-1]
MQQRGWFYRWILLGFALIFPMLACSLPTSQQGTLLSSQTDIPLDPVFVEFYQNLGGRAVLGRVLSAPFDDGQKRYQYVEAGLVAYDPTQMEPGKRIRFEPLGLELQVHDDTDIPVIHDETHDLLVEGYWVYSEFVETYKRLSLFAGSPLTHVRFNHQYARYEQFFENLGFYRELKDAPGTVRLLPYGAYLCGVGCSQRSQEYWNIVQNGLIMQPFERFVNAQKWEALGKPLAAPTITPEGMLEQVYENAILYAPVDRPADIAMRPLTLWLGKVSPQTPYPYREQAGTVFYPVEDHLGFLVPQEVDALIVRLGGVRNSGKPLGDAQQVSGEGVYRQCFENYCVDYQPTAPAGQRVRLVPQGVEYAQRLADQLTLPRAFTPETVNLLVSEAYPQVSDSDHQVLQMNVFYRQSGEPMYLVSGTATVTLPGRTLTLSLPPTNRNGASSVTLPPLKGVSNLSVIEYQICLELPSPAPICQSDTFVVFNAP